MSIYFLSLGSNIAPETNFQLMLQELADLDPHLTVSRILRTAALGFASNNPFLNGVVRLRSDLAPAALKRLLVEIELRLGRERADPLSKVKDRVADVDILFALPAEADHVPADLLPQEPYVRPILLELLAALDYRFEASVGALPAGQPLLFDGQTIGLVPIRLNKVNISS